ncbi:MAG: FeoB-associated Cys-rich membrane protein [Acholeplasmataceae bacterium]
MTLADIIILIVTAGIIFGIIYQMVKHKDEKACKVCSYSQNKITK